MPLSRTRAPVSTSAPPVFPRIVCGVDGTLAGQAAADQAMALTGPGGKVVLVCARDGWAHASRRGVGLVARRVERALEATRAAAQRLDVDCDVEVADSPNPFELLLDRAGHADLLVVGSRGRSRAGDYALGTTAAAAVHASAGPVLVARRAPRAVPFPSRILVGTDGSASGAHALSVAARIARHADATLSLLSVEPRLHGGRHALREELLTLEAEAGRRVTLIRAVGEPTVQLARAAESEAAALLVIGARDPARLHVMESVSTRVAHRAGCSVLVAR